jgi:hypothetical protein
VLRSNFAPLVSGGFRDAPFEYAWSERAKGFLLKGKKTYERDKNLCLVIHFPKREEREKDFFFSLSLNRSLCVHISFFFFAVAHLLLFETQADNSNRNNRSVVRCKSAPRV